MGQQHYALLAFCLSVVTSAVVYALYRRRRQSYLLGWMRIWLLLAGRYALELLSLATNHPLAHAGSEALLLLAALSLVALAAGTPLRPVVRPWHLLAAVLGIAWSSAHAYHWPPGVDAVGPSAGAAALIVYCGFCFWRFSQERDSLGLRLLTLASLIVGIGLAAGSLSSLSHALLDAGYIGSTYGMLLMAIAMVMLVNEEAQETVEENLLGLSSLNLATSGYQTARSLREILELVLERILRVYGLTQGLITLGSSEQQAGLHLFRGFRPGVVEEWEERNLDAGVTGMIERMGGMLILRDVQLPQPAGRLESDPAYTGFRRVMQQTGVQALLAIGLRTKTGSYGALALAHPAHRIFSVAELRLLAALGTQIAMAVENFLLVRQSQRRAEELHLLNQTGQALSSTLNPDALLRLIHQEIQKLVDAKNFYIALWDEAHDELRFELEVENGAYLPKRRRKAQQAITEYVLRTRQPLLLTTSQEEFRAQHGIEPSGRPSLSWLGVPLMLYDRAIGVMAVQNYEREYAYDEGHLDIMKTLAAQAAIALENARLFTEEQRRLRQLSFLHNVSRIAISTLNADQMLAEIAREIQKNFDYDHIGIGLLDYQTKEIEIKAEAGLHAQALGRRIPLDAGIIGRVARTGETVLANDLMDQKPARSILTNARSELCLPIVYADQMLGVLNVESVQEAAFQQEDVLILRTLADHLSTALHNAFIFQRTQQQAITDGLTGVKTHRYFTEALQGEWKRATRSGRVFSLLELDLDRFKQVNDTMGHLEGDLVLARLGKILEQRCRQSNVVARYGGDEFTILMPEATTEQAQILAERLRLWIATDPIFAERKLTASFGLASFPAFGDSPEEIMRAADAGLYLAKHQGGNMVGMAEQFRRQETGALHGHMLLTYLESISRRLESTGPETLETLLQRLEEAWPAFPGDPLELERAVLEGLGTLAEAVERRVHPAGPNRAGPDRPGGHVQAVTRYATMLAGALQLAERELEDLQAAARLHDIGYVAVPGSMLAKPGKLTPAEFAVVQTHAGAGARLLETMHVNPGVVAAVRYHHEFYNGTGYPEGLAAEDIPLAARILAVADAFDALTTERPYRRARTVAEAVQELERFSGTQFDPHLVRAFVKVIRAESAAAETIPAG